MSTQNSIDMPVGHDMSMMWYFQNGYHYIDRVWNPIASNCGCHLINNVPRIVLSTIQGLSWYNMTNMFDWAQIRIYVFIRFWNLGIKMTWSFESNLGVWYLNILYVFSTTTKITSAPKAPAVGGPLMVPFGWLNQEMAGMAGLNWCGIWSFFGGSKAIVHSYSHQMSILFIIIYYNLL